MQRSILLNDSHSITLLGQIPPSAPQFVRYRSLIENGSKWGKFLSYENSSEWLSCYEHDAQALQTKLPLIVFRPHTRMDIAPFVAACHERNLPVTVRCGGTGLSGGCVPCSEGILILTGHLKQINAYDAKQGRVSIEPGVTVRQLNRHVEKECWHFPLSMATEGVAGIAGCLSSHARGYHQQQKPIFHMADKITLVDGQGSIFDAPSSFVCGSEGLWGIIIEMSLTLQRKRNHSLKLAYQGGWQNILSQMSVINSLNGLEALQWFQDTFHFDLEGDKWRLDQVETILNKCLPGIQISNASSLNHSSKFSPTRQPFVVLSTAFQPDQLPTACQWSLERAKEIQLECLQHADVLAGSLHLILQSSDNFYTFSQKIERFFVIWSDYVDRQQGVLASCHGVGLQMRPYMTPFWQEESLQFLKKLKATFDPKGLLNQEQFFPKLGKSLEKVRQNEH